MPNSIEKTNVFSVWVHNPLMIFIEGCNAV